MSSLAASVRRAIAETPRAQVEALEREVLKLPQVDLKTSHVLAGGVYSRTIVIPAGTVLTGAVHKRDHINVMQGDITVTTDAGPQRFTGHHVIATKAGAKRAGYAHADTIWTTICRTDSTDLEAIEAELVEESERLQTRHPSIDHAPLLALPE